MKLMAKDPARPVPVGRGDAGRPGEDPRGDPAPRGLGGATGRRWTGRTRAPRRSPPTASQAASWPCGAREPSAPVAAAPRRGREPSAGAGHGQGRGGGRTGRSPGRPRARIQRDDRDGGHGDRPLRRRPGGLVGPRTRTCSRSRRSRPAGPPASGSSPGGAAIPKQTRSAEDQLRYAQLRAPRDEWAAAWLAVPGILPPFPRRRRRRPTPSSPGSGIAWMTSSRWRRSARSSRPGRRPRSATRTSPPSSGWHSSCKKGDLGRGREGVREALRGRCGRHVRPDPGRHEPGGLLRCPAGRAEVGEPDHRGASAQGAAAARAAAQSASRSARPPGPCARIPPAGPPRVPRDREIESERSSRSGGRRRAWHS